MEATTNDFTIHRIAIRSREEESKFCASCEREKDKGLWMFCPPLIGSQSLFVCDDCISAAKTHKFITNGKPRN